MYYKTKWTFFKLRGEKSPNKFEADFCKQMSRPNNTAIVYSDFGLIRKLIKLID